MLTLAHGHTAAHRTEPGTSLFTALWQLGAKSKDTSLQCQTQPGATQEHSAHRLSTDIQSSLSVPTWELYAIVVIIVPVDS